MTFGQLVRDVARESHAGVTKRQVATILVCMWRLMLEELFADPYNAKVEIQGIGRFYMNLSTFHSPNDWIAEDGTKKESPTIKRWILKFRPYPALKKVLKNKADIRDMKVGSYPMYPDGELNQVVSRRTSREMIHYSSPKKSFPVTKKSIALKEEKKTKSIKDRLPED